jgi:hypothetical protein
MAGFAPFGITLFGTSNLWVSYAMQDGPKHDPVHQVGAGYINIFTTDGVFERRCATGGNLNAPWGMVLTPTSFGPLGGNFWIGNFGDGNINTFDGMGNSKGQPTDDKAKALNVDGLWALVFGDGTNNAATTSLYFTAGPNMESEGIFGKFEVSTKKSKVFRRARYARSRSRNDVATHSRAADGSRPNFDLEGPTPRPPRAWPNGIRTRCDGICESVFHAIQKYLSDRETGEPR